MSSASVRPASAPKKGAKPASPAAAQAPAGAPPIDWKQLSLRMGLPLLGVWILAIWWHRTVGFVLAGALTAAAAGLVYWVVSRTQKATRVRDIVGAATTKQERDEALEQIDREFKKDDAAAAFAKAQLHLQNADAKAALATLEGLDLGKLMPTEADQARAQRAMIHLMINEVQPARQLADVIDVSKQPDAKSKAMVAAIVAEAWARTGQSKRASELLSPHDPNDPALAELRPSLLRAQVWIFAGLDKIKEARSAMHQLAKGDPQQVLAFAAKGVHPLVVEEAKKIAQRSNLVKQVKIRQPMR